MLAESVYTTNPDMKIVSDGLVKTAARSEKSQVIDIILLAFATDPVARWTYPNPRQYLEFFPNFIRMFGGKAFETKSAIYVDDYSAAALWLPPNVSPDEHAIVSLFKNTVHCKIQDELFYVFEEMGKFHPSEPHWYLPMIGTDPTRQNKGYDLALMRHALARCDADGLPAYLESSNPRNIPLYQRFGFEIVGKIQVGSSPPMYPMRREPSKAFSEYETQISENN